MTKTLAYVSLDKQFRFLDNTEVVLEMMRAMQEKGIVKSYGNWCFSEDADLPEFSGSQLVDALMFASKHGRRAEIQQE